MNFLCVVAVAAVGFIALAQGAPSEDHKRHHHGPPQCLGKNLTLSEEMKKAEKSCCTKQPEDKTKTADDKKTRDHHDHKHPHNMTCHMVCKYQAFGLISADHKINNDKIEAFVKQVFPESVTAALTKEITACADKNGTGLSVKDGKCDSYEPLFKCIHKSIKENCKMEDDNE